MHGISKMENFLIATRAGGQGRTLVAQLLGFAGLVGHGSLQRVTVEIPPNSRARSKLARALPHTIDIPVSAPFSQIVEVGARAVSHFDMLGELLEKCGAVVDVGANALPIILHWLQATGETGSLDLAPINLVIPTTAQAEAIREATAAMLQGFAAFELRRVIIVVNGRDGKPDFSAGTPGQLLGQMFKSDGVVEPIRFRKCESALLPLAESKSLSLASVLSMTAERAEQVFQLGLQRTFLELEALREWVEMQLGTFRGNGPLAPPTSQVCR